MGKKLIYAIKKTIYSFIAEIWK